MPPRKRKPAYPTRPKPKRAPDTIPRVLPRATVSIDPTAGAGRGGLTVGDRVRINGSGLYAGEAAVIERFSGNVIPAAVVRTESGGSRQVRTIDLEPIEPRG